MHKIKKIYEVPNNFFCIFLAFFAIISRYFVSLHRISQNSEAHRTCSSVG